MSDPNAGAESHRAEQFWWFDGETTAELNSQLAAAGPGARLEVHPVGHKLWLHVIPANHTAESVAKAVSFQPLDKSWECPPICP